MLACFTGVATKLSGGNLVPVAASATVEVRRKDTGALATIFSDEAGATPIANPSSFQDSLGRFFFYAAGILRGYEVTVTDGGLTYTLHNVGIGTLAQQDPGTVGQQLVSLGTFAKGSRLVGTGSNIITEEAVPAVAGRILIVDPTQSDGWLDVDAPFTGFMNRIINGDMRIDQANAGASVSVNTTAVFYSADQWLAFGTNTAGVFSLQQLSATPPTGFKNYLRITTTTADAAPAAASQYAIATYIEGQNVIDFALGTANAIAFTASFWVRSSLTGSFSGAFRNGAANRSYPFSFTINSANTWEYKTVTLTGDTTGTWAIDNTAGLEMILDMGGGANLRGAAGAWAGSNLHGVTSAVRLISTLSATLDVTGVEINKGSVAMPFEFRGFQEELARCERYYETSYDFGVKPGTVNGNGAIAPVIGMASSNVSTMNVTVPFKVPKRVTPTMTGYSPTSGASGKFRDSTNAADINSAFGSLGMYAATFGFTPSAPTASASFLAHFTADSRL